MKTDKTYIIKRLLTDIVYPNRCPFCGDIIPYNEYYHGECSEKINISGDSHRGIVSVCLYDERSKEFIRKAKENADGHAISAAASLLSQKLDEYGITDNIDLITSIPAKKASLKKRGYCFPSLLAKEIGEITGLPFSKKLLINLNKSFTQKELSFTERIENMKEAFAFNARYDIKGLRILLIDDVCVTGATINSAKELLLRNNAAEVKCAAFAERKADGII